MKESGSFERELTTRKNSDTAGLNKSGTSIEVTGYYPRAKTLLYFRDRLKKSLDAAVNVTAS